MRNKRTPKELLLYVLAFLLSFAVGAVMLAAAFCAARLVERSLGGLLGW